MKLNNFEALLELRKKLGSEENVISNSVDSTTLTVGEKSVSLEKKKRRERLKAAKQEVKRDSNHVDSINKKGCNSSKSGEMLSVPLKQNDEESSDEFVFDEENEKRRKKIIESGRPIKSILSEFSIFTTFKKKELEDPLINATDIVREKFRQLYLKRESIIDEIQKNSQLMEEYRYTIKQDFVRESMISTLEKETEKLRAELSSNENTIKKRLYDLDLDIEMERDRILLKKEKEKEQLLQERWNAILEIATAHAIPNNEELDIDEFEKYVHYEIERKEILSNANSYDIDLANISALSNKELERYIKQEIKICKLKDFINSNNLEVDSSCCTIEEYESAIKNDVEHKLSLLHSLMLETKENFEDEKKNFNYLVKNPSITVPEITPIKVNSSYVNFNIGVFDTPEEIFKSLESVELNYNAKLESFLSEERNRQQENITHIEEIIDDINKEYTRWKSEYPYFQFIELENAILGVSETFDFKGIGRVTVTEGFQPDSRVFDYKLLKGYDSNVVTTLAIEDDSIKNVSMPSNWREMGITFGTQIDDIAIILYKNLFEIEEIDLQEKRGYISAKSLDNNIKLLLTFKKIELNEPLEISLGYMLHSIKCDVSVNQLALTQRILKKEKEKRINSLSNLLYSLKSEYLDKNLIDYDFDVKLFESLITPLNISKISMILLVETAAATIAKSRGKRKIEKILQKRISVISKILSDKKEEARIKAENARKARINDIIKNISSNRDIAFDVAEGFVNMMKRDNCFEYQYICLLINHMGVGARRTFFDKYLLKEVTSLLIKEGEYACRRKQYITDFVDLLYSYYSRAWKMTIPMDLVYSLSEMFPDFKKKDLPVRTKKTFRLDWDWVKFGNGILTIEQPKDQYEIQFEPKSFKASWFNPELKEIAMLSKAYIMPLICTAINRQLSIDKDEFEKVLILILKAYNKIQEENAKRNEKALRDIRKAVVSLEDFVGMKSNCMRHLKSIQHKDYPIYKCNEKTSVPEGRQYEIETGYLFTAKSYLSDRIVSLIYENKNMDRATYVFKVDSRSYGLAVKSILEYFESIGPRKRKDLLENEIPKSKLNVLDYAQVIHLNYDYNDWLNILNDNMW